MNVPTRRIAGELDRPLASRPEAELAVDPTSSNGAFREMELRPLSMRPCEQTHSLAHRIGGSLARVFTGKRTSRTAAGGPLRLADMGQTAIEMGLATPAQLAQAALDADASQREGRRVGPGVALSRTCGLPARQVASFLGRYAKGYRVSTDSALLGNRLRAVTNDQRQSILICGLRHWDDADIVAAGAGVALALTTFGPVAIVDCNFRRPSMHQLFGFDQSLGTLAVMSGAAKLDAAVCHTGVADLVMLPVEEAEVAPSLAFSEKTSLDRIFGPLENRQAVIVSAPPLLECPETLMLAARVTNILLVTAANVGRGADLAEAESMLGSVRAKALGVVLARKS